jgi:uncharacterized FlaG/YvyC family protein
MDSVSLSNASSTLFQGQSGSSLTTPTPAPQAKPSGPAASTKASNDAISTPVTTSSGNANFTVSVAYDKNIKTTIFTIKDPSSGLILEHIPEIEAGDLLNSIQATGNSPIGNIVNTSS